MRTIIALAVWMTVFVAIGLLYGCGIDPVAVQPTAQIVKEPVVVPCVDHIPQPDTAFMTDAQLLDGSDYQVVENLRIDRDQRRVYESTLVAVMQGCVQSATTK